jgi:hypothetical protein
MMTSQNLSESTFRGEFGWLVGWLPLFIVDCADFLALFPCRFLVETGDKVVKICSINP